MLINPSLFCISDRFYRTQNSFGPLNNHMIPELSWVVIMVTAHAHRCHLAVTWSVTVITGKTTVIAGYLPYQITQNRFLGLWNINEWWKGHKLHIVTRCGCNVVSHVTYLPILPQGRARHELSHRGNELRYTDRKVITYQNPQSNLPELFVFYR